ncbi:MAG: hypothetical protein J6J17_05105 [Bacilli bacterium]|nr:hypothetical protein [Bacilli bacterium]
MTKLFSKEKDIFLKVINSILVIWLMVAIVITFGVGIKLINKENIGTYEEYAKEVCVLDKLPYECTDDECKKEIDEERKENCEYYYLQDKKSVDQMNKVNIDNILISISNIVIVSLFLHLLNKRAK